MNRFLYCFAGEQCSKEECHKVEVFVMCFFHTCIICKLIGSPTCPSVCVLVLFNQCESNLEKWLLWFQGHSTFNLTLKYHLPAWLYIPLILLFQCPQVYSCLCLSFFAESLEQFLYLARVITTQLHFA